MENWIHLDLIIKFSNIFKWNIGTLSGRYDGRGNYAVIIF